MASESKQEYKVIEYTVTRRVPISTPEEIEKRRQEKNNYQKTRYQTDEKYREKKRQYMKARYQKQKEAQKLHTNEAVSIPTN
jgi:hypothetical protein